MENKQNQSTTGIQEQPTSDKYQSQYRQLGLKVAYFRKLRGYSQEKLAEKSGYSRTHISNIEAPNMANKPSLDAIFSIADALDIPVKKLFNFEDTND